MMMPLHEIFSGYPEPRIYPVQQNIMDIPDAAQDNGLPYSTAYDGLTETGFSLDKDNFLEELWRQFSDIPMDPATECIETAFFIWGPGVNREDIWHWFDQRHSCGVAYLLYGCGTV